MKTLAVLVAITVGASAYAELPKPVTTTTGQAPGPVTKTTVIPVIKLGPVGVGPAGTSTTTGTPGTRGATSSESKGVGATYKFK